MILGTYTIGSQQILWYQIDFPWLDDEITITVDSTSVTPEDGAPGSPEFEVFETEVVGHSVFFRAGGGVEGYEYTVAIDIDTSDDQHAHVCVVFTIDDGGC